MIDHKFYLPKSCMVHNILLHCFHISGCLTTAQCQAKCHAMDINHKEWFSFFRSVLTPSTLPVMNDAPSLPILITWGPWAHCVLWAYRALLYEEIHHGLQGHFFFLSHTRSCARFLCNSYVSKEMSLWNNTIRQ